MSSPTFTLEPVTDRKWGVSSRARVAFDGKQTGLVLAGTTLHRQDETYSGFLLWVGTGVRSDATLHIYLLSPAATVLDVRSIVGDGGARLNNAFAAGYDVFQFGFRIAERWQLVVRKEPRRVLFRRAYDWWQSGLESADHTAYFAYRYLELERIWL